MAKKKKSLPFLIQNKKAGHNYEITETLEAGISLTGSEVKSLREKQGSLLEAFFIFKGGELFVQNFHIPEYKNGGYANHAPLRIRKILVHRSERDRMFGLMKEKGINLVPVRLYLKGRNIKLLIGLGKGKKAADKRRALREKDDKKQMKRFLG